MKIKKTKKFTGILLILCLAVIGFAGGMTALMGGGSHEPNAVHAAANEPTQCVQIYGGGRLTAATPWWYGEEDTRAVGSWDDMWVQGYFDASTGTLTVKNMRFMFNKQAKHVIRVNSNDGDNTPGPKDLTIKLIGDRNILSLERTHYQGAAPLAPIWNESGGNITITAEQDATLEIIAKNNSFAFYNGGCHGAYGIVAGTFTEKGNSNLWRDRLVSGGSISIEGKAKVNIDAYSGYTNSLSPWHAMGLNAYQNITIKDDAEVSIKAESELSKFYDEAEIEKYIEHFDWSFVRLGEEGLTERQKNDARNILRAYARSTTAYGIRAATGMININTTKKVTVDCSSEKFRSGNGYANNTIALSSPGKQPVMTKAEELILRWESYGTGGINDIAGPVERFSAPLYNATQYVKSQTPWSADTYSEMKIAPAPALFFTHSSAYNVPAGIVNTTIATIDVSGTVSGGIPIPGSLPYKYSISGPASSWLRLINPYQGFITGTRPLTTQSNSAAVVTVEDSLGQKKSITIQVGAITAIPLVSSNSTINIPTGALNTAISPAINVSYYLSGGTSPFTYSLVGTQWFTISSSGVISGTRPDTPQAAKTATVKVTDLTGQFLNININVGAVTVAPLVFDNSSAFDIPTDETGTSVTAINLSGGVSGGKAPYTFSIASGIKWFDLDPSTGEISGTRPDWSQAAGTSTIRVTDSLGSFKEITINVAAVTSAFTKSVSVGTQIGTLKTDHNSTVQGSVTFSVATVDIANGMTATIEWYKDPYGKTPLEGYIVSELSFSMPGISAIGPDGTSTITINKVNDYTPSAGKYYFQITIDSMKSNIVEYTILNYYSLVFDYSSFYYDVPTGLVGTAITPIAIPAMSVPPSGGVKPWTFTVEGSESSWLSISDGYLVGVRPSTPQAASKLTIRITDAIGETDTIEITVGQVWAQSYTVIVNGGSGYMGQVDWFPGESVSIWHDTPPEGYSFDGWTVDSGGVTIDETFLGDFFTMPAQHVEVTAVYTKIPPEFPFVFDYNESFDVPDGAPGTTITTIDVSGGVSGGFVPYTYNMVGPDWLSIDSGTGVISGTRPIKRLDATTAIILVTDSEGEVKSITISIGEVTLGYMTLPEYDIPTDDPNTTITSIDLGTDITGGSGTFTYEMIVGPEWLSMNSSGVITGMRPATPQVASLLIILVTDDIMGDTLYVYIPVGAVLDSSTTYAVTITDGTADKTTVSQCDVVTIEADPAAEGKIFDKWVIISGTVLLEFDEMEITSFVMPAGAVSIKATYRHLIISTVKVNYGSGSEDYGEKETVTIKANTAATGYEFDKWVIVSGTIILADANNSTTTFLMPGHDVEVTATYKIKTYIVTFKDHDGTVIGTPQTINHGAAATAPADPTLTGWTFTGWDTAFDNVTNTLIVNAVYTENDTTPTVCTVCENDPCTCDTTPTVCTVCENDPCTCDTTPTVCTTCENDPCTCDTTPTVCTTCGNDPCTCKDGGLGTGAIVGIVIGVLALLGGGIALYWFVIRKKI